MSFTTGGFHQNAMIMAIKKSKNTNQHLISIDRMDQKYTLTSTIKSLSIIDTTTAIQCKLCMEMTLMKHWIVDVLPWNSVNMMTSSNGNISTLLTFCEENPPVTVGFRSQRPVTRGFDVFFYLRVNKQLNKQSRRRWFETPSRPLWRHCNEISSLLNVIRGVILVNICIEIWDDTNQFVADWQITGMY